jgi:hypothetical protein
MALRNSATQPAAGSPELVPRAPATSLHQHSTRRIGQVSIEVFGWQTLYQCNRDIITNPDLIYPSQRLFIC